MWHSK